jgi:hypothetical protein
VISAESRVRAALAAFAAGVQPRPALSLIRDRTCRTAAPEAPGTADITDGWKEPTMSHDLIEEGTPRGLQMAGAFALAKLIERGPHELAEWRIDDLGRLHGHVHRAHSDTAAREALAAFAEFLGTRVERRQGRNDRAEWVHLSVVAEYRGTQVRVWTHVDIRPASPYGSFGGTR